MDLRYPIGPFEVEGEISPERRLKYIDQIAAAPNELKRSVAGLSPSQLDTPYRAGGWTVRQVVHHVPDSHLNSYVRFKMALTEDEPTIKPYHEDKWAELVDTKDTPIDVSLELLENLHHRWVVLLLSISPSDFARTFRHPDMGVVGLDRSVALYAWHGRHHVAHITSLRERMGWGQAL